MRCNKSPSILPVMFLAMATFVMASPAVSSAGGGDVDGVNALFGQDAVLRPHAVSSDADRLEGEADAIAGVRVILPCSNGTVHIRLLWTPTGQVFPFWVGGDTDGVGGNPLF